MLTYWEERNPGTPSRQQRWYQWMSNQDAGPMVGALGAGWDGVDRAHMFAGEPAVLDPADPRYGELSPVARFPENQAAQEWIYRDAPEEIERPYQVDAVEEPTMEFFAPEVAAVQKAMAQGGAGKLKAAQYRQQQSASQEAARSAGQHSSYGYAGNGGTTYGDKAAQWEDPIGEIPVLPRSKTVHSVVQTSLNKSQQLSLQQRRAHAPRHKGDSMPPFPSLCRHPTAAMCVRRVSTEPRAATLSCANDSSLGIFAKSSDRVVWRKRRGLEVGSWRVSPYAWARSVVCVKGYARYAQWRTKH